MPEPVDVVLLSGTVGAGKTTTAHALSDLLRTAGVRHAVVDLDEIRLLRPPPDGDRFAHEVELANLRDLARNFAAAGAERLVLAGVVEEAVEGDRYRGAVTGRLLLVRLLVRPDRAAVRLRHRHAEEPEARTWHLHRTDELAAVLDAAPFEDAHVDTTDRTPAQVALEVARLAGWAG